MDTDALISEICRRVMEKQRLWKHRGRTQPIRPNLKS